MTKLQVVSTCVIMPGKPIDRNSPTKNIHLTPWDLQLLTVDPIQKGLLFRKPNPQQHRKLATSSEIINRLKTSLSDTLDFFPLLAGRLAACKNSDNTLSFFINCNNEGAEFTHATAPGLTVADIVEPTYVPKIVKSFFPLNGVHNFEVTELVDGFFIGCTINHCVADGTSFWHFFNSWSEISRTRSSNLTVNKLPVLERWFPKFTASQIHVTLPKEHLYDEFDPPLLEERVFHFSKENIAQLKAKANSEFGTDQKTCISSLQAVLAHLWQTVIRCRTGTKADEKFSFKILIGARPRLQPPLREGYFGNAVHFVNVTTTARELLENNSGWAALQMNKVVAMQTHEEVMNFYQSWVKNPKIVKKSEVVTNSLIASSSPRFDVYGNDFGWGRPIAVRSGAGNKHDGKMTIFSGVEEGSIDIEACLTPETLHAMGEDANFMEAVTV
ncbi:putative acetyltransferase At3g50280 isoform X1 [Nicotiana tabacum]|uniref:Acetyltransferase At3g50280 isoform X1 n=1 Tax=Nicotiana tabacum TaxID=4097 RepID=A0A1S4C6D9_TOBAC|nr:PREDICTED: uncharacterized acetyltransferase At3g50280-like isoform X1 [Nicotiana tabacum]XP_033509495.1 uncharacterized acetyltransferase At3g50280-like isoform X2 [Nicotiana tomentosiformis]